MGFAGGLTTAAGDGRLLGCLLHRQLGDVAGVLAVDGEVLAGGGVEQRQLVDRQAELRDPAHVGRVLDVDVEADALDLQLPSTLSVAYSNGTLTHGCAGEMHSPAGSAATCEPGAVANTSRMMSGSDAPMAAVAEPPRAAARSVGDS